MCLACLYEISDDMIWQKILLSCILTGEKVFEVCYNHVISFYFICFSIYEQSTQKIRTVSTCVCLLLVFTFFWVYHIGTMTKDATRTIFIIFAYYYIITKWNNDNTVYQKDDDDSDRYPKYVCVMKEACFCLYHILMQEFLAVGYEWVYVYCHELFCFAWCFVIYERKKKFRFFCSCKYKYACIFIKMIF